MDLDNTHRRGDRSPEPTPEQVREHQRLAEEVNYRIALNELAFYVSRSTLHDGRSQEARDGHAWTDDRGRVWLSESRISSPARNELTMIVDVIQDYEGRNGERDKEQQALDGIAEVRAARNEPVPDRLAYFERNAVQPDTERMAPEIDAERATGHGTEIER